MSRVLTFCWREWRAQRGILLAYTGLGLACLCLAFLLVPEEQWQHDGERAVALSWFLALGVGGVVAFVAPNLVRSEFAAKTDQFVRRLPGALRPSFGGKLLFLVLAATALPLVCLLAGQWFLLAIGQPWHDLFAWEWTGEVRLALPWTAPWLLGAMLLAPWVWAIGTWLPRGRMALGGAILFVLLLAAGTYFGLEQSPGLANLLVQQPWPWLWLVAPGGVLIAGLSWTVGRRGGGPLRSARWGFVGVAIVLAAPAWWLGGYVRAFHWPDARRLDYLHVAGGTPDGRYLLAYGSELNLPIASVVGEGRMPAPAVPLRIDLRDGSMTQLGGIDTVMAGGVGLPWNVAGSRRRYWYEQPRNGDATAGVAVLDLVTLAREPLPWDAERDAPAAVAQAAYQQFARDASRLRGPGDRRVYWMGDSVYCEVDGGAVVRVPWPGARPGFVSAIGHGFLVFGADGDRIFDATTGEWRPSHRRSGESYWLVRGVLVRGRKDAAGQMQWVAQRSHEVDDPLPDLAGCQVLGLVSDDELLAVTRTAPEVQHLVLFHVGDRVATSVALPERFARASVRPLSPLGEARLARDPAGRVWLEAFREDGMGMLWLDAASRLCHVGCETWPAQCGLIDWPDASSAIVQDGTRIERLDLSTGARDVLFPRPAR